MTKPTDSTNHSKAGQLHSPGSTLRLDGLVVAKARRLRLSHDIAQWSQRRGGAKPGLAVVLVGEDPASQVYVRNKIKACAEVGISSFHHHLRATAQQQELLELIAQLNHDPQVHGVLVQLPLPDHLNTREILQSLDPRKDPDGLTAENQGLLFMGSPRVIPCTPKGVVSILEHYQLPIAGSRAVVVGRSQIVGNPMAQLLTQANATVALCHSKTKDIGSYLKQADLVVVAAGQAQRWGREDFCRNAIVIDVGIHRRAEGMGVCGDVRFEELLGWARAVTPVPGGVGPMTITSLLENTFTLANG